VFHHWYFSFIFGWFFVFLFFPDAPPGSLHISRSILPSSVSPSESSPVVLDYTVKPPVTPFYSHCGARLSDAPASSDELSFDVLSSSLIKDVPSSHAINHSSLLMFLLSAIKLILLLVIMMRFLLLLLIWSLFTLFLSWLLFENNPSLSLMWRMYFLMVNLRNDVYMCPPPGYSVTEGMIYHLRRSLYDLGFLDLILTFCFGGHSLWFFCQCSWSSSLCPRITSW
jgi:hypothetical protein